MNPLAASVRLVARSLLLAALASINGNSAVPASEIAAGRGYYAEAEFRKAVGHFQLAVKADPNDAEAYYWAGMSFHQLGNIAAPFGGRYHAKARGYLAEAIKLAPNRTDYRRALFDLLLDSGNPSRRALQDAGGVLAGLAKSDPEYQEMYRRLENARGGRFSPGALLRALYSVEAVPILAFSAAWR